LEDIFEGLDANVTFSEFLIFYEKFNACFTEIKLNSTHGYKLWKTGELNIVL